MEAATIPIAGTAVSPSTTPLKTTAASLVCTICGDRAFGKYVNVLVCAPCKMFFRRNASINQAQMHCHFDGRCRIDVRNRHACRSCRLKKCFASGMQSDLLRGPQSQTKGKKTRPDASRTSTSTNTLQLQQLPTMNLLRADRSTLSAEQWNLLSNLFHCYDEHSGLSVADRFVRDQNALPLKMRFKSTAVSDMVGSLMDAGRVFFEKNADFLSLIPQDRSLLLHGKLKYIGCLGTCVIVHTLGLYDELWFCSAIETLYGAEALDASLRTVPQLDPDIIFVKLVLAILLFSAFDHTVYEHTAPVNFINVQAILRIQDVYTELAWRYLVYKYDHWHAVTCFSKFIRCLFTVNNALVEAIAREQFSNLVDSLIEQTEQTISLNN